MTDVFLTILSGVCVFVFSQFFLVFFIKPRAELKTQYAILSSVMLNYHAQYTNANLNPDQVIEIRLAANEFLSKAWQVNKARHKQEKILRIIRSINLILAQSILETPDYTVISDCVTEIEKLDQKLIITLVDT